MADLSHYFGNDLALSANGDLLTVDTTILGQQRVLRRLMTMQNSYIWQLNYGAGLPGFVGNPAQLARIKAIARNQMFLESVVARSPAPQISVYRAPNDPTTVVLNITYVDAPSKKPVVLSLNLGNG